MDGRLASTVPRQSFGPQTARAMRWRGAISDLQSVLRQVSVQNAMAVTLICPKCKAGTELRGMLDAYYLTWCDECARLWRVELWTLVHTDEPERKIPWASGR